jgi:hypothetical protein
MKISAYIRDQVLARRLRERQVLVVYDAAGRYREIVLSLGCGEVEVIDAGESIIEARERAMEALMARGLQPEKMPYVLVYVPAGPPADDDGRCVDPFSALAEAGDWFPRGDGDSYLELCLQAKPDFGTRVRELFAGGVPPFEAVDAIGGDGGQYPRLKTELGCESNAEILATLLAPHDGHEIHLKTGGACRAESLSFLSAVIGFEPRKAGASWSIIQGELWRYVLFSEFVFDLPTDVPESLSNVSIAPAETVDLINRVCASLRDGVRSRAVYIEESERVATDLDLEKELAGIRNLGVRDTFSFEERSFLAGYIDALKAGDFPQAEAIAGARKGSIWVQESDRQLLWTLAARLLELLRGIADFDRELQEAKPDTAGLMAFYTGRGYRLDQRYRYFEETLTEIEHDSEDLDQLVEGCRLKYRSCVDSLQRKFITAVRQSGWPVAGHAAAASLFDSRIKPLLADKSARVGMLWVDALRYELAVALNESLSGTHRTELQAVCGALPSITPVGMASLLPEAAAKLTLRRKDDKLIPFLGDRPLPASADRVSVLAGLYGDRFLDVSIDELLKGKPTKAVHEKYEHIALALVRYHRIDLNGESHAPDLFRMIKVHTDYLLRAVRRLSDLGFTDIFLFTDHGFMVFPERHSGNKAAKPDGNWTLAKERVLAGNGSENPETVRFTAQDLGVSGDIDHLVFPKTLATFTEGVLYYHGGLSIQECVIPSLHIRSDHAEPLAKPSWELRLGYRGKSTGIATTRRPMIEIAAFSEDMFQQDISFNLIAISPSGEIVGSAASSDFTDKNTGHVSLRTGQTAKIPLRLAEEFNGAFEVRAQDTETNKYLGNTVKLETKILE